MWAIGYQCWEDQSLTFCCTYHISYRWGSLAPFYNAPGMRWFSRLGNSPSPPIPYVFPQIHLWDSLTQDPKPWAKTTLLVWRAWSSSNCGLEVLWSIFLPEQPGSWRWGRVCPPASISYAIKNITFLVSIICEIELTCIF